MAVNSELRNLIAYMASAINNIPREWDGRESILAMKEANYPHWKQMEWIGFYFQFLCEKTFAGVLAIPGKKYGRTEFDGFGSICWDFKAHAMNAIRHKVIGNDMGAIAQTIEEFEYYGLILAAGKAQYNDEERTFKQWHDALKGRKSDYELARMERGAPSRLRKTEFALSEIRFICLDLHALNQCGGSFQQGFRNSDGSPRKGKVMIDIAKIPGDSIIRTARF